MSGNKSSFFLEIVFIFVYMINSVLQMTFYAGGVVIQLMSLFFYWGPFKAAWDSILSPLPGINLWTEGNSTSENNDFATRQTAEISKLKDDIARLTAEISKSKVVSTDGLTSEISKLKDDIARLTAEISKSKDDIATGLKSLEELLKEFKEDEALIKSSTFALINPRPIFPTLPPEAFTASSSWVGDDVCPSMSLLHKASTRQDSFCWSAANNDPNGYIQVNLGQLYLVNEIQTRGRGGSKYNQYIKNYKVGYVHHEQKVEVTLLNLQNESMFDGNYSETEIASNKYFKPFIAQYIKLYPNEWNGHKSLNWEVIGVPLSKIDEKGLKMLLLTSFQRQGQLQRTQGVHLNSSKDIINNYND